MFDERENSVVLDVSRLAESLLQLLLHVCGRVQQIDLWLLQPEESMLWLRCIRRKCSYTIFFTVHTSSEELILVPVSPGTIGFIRWERLAKPRVGKYWRHERLHLVHSFYEWFSLSVFYVRVIKVNTFQLLFQISKKVIHVLLTLKLIIKFH